MQIDRGAHPKYTNRLRLPAVLLQHQNGVKLICPDDSFGSFPTHSPVKAYSEPIVYPCAAYRRSSGPACFDGKNTDTGIYRV